MSEFPRHGIRDDHDRTPGILTVKLGCASRLSLPVDAIETPVVGERWRPYAIGEYEGFQLSSEATAILAEKGVVTWEAWHRPFTFDVSQSPPSDLTLSLFVRDRDADTATTGNLNLESSPLD